MDPEKENQPEEVDEKTRVKKEVWDSLWLLSLGINLVICTLIGLFFGRYLDRVFGTQPIFMIIFLGFGIAAGARGFYRAVKKLL